MLVTIKMKELFIIKDLITNRYIKYFSKNGKYSFGGILTAKTWDNPYLCRLAVEVIIKENKFISIETIYR